VPSGELLMHFDDLRAQAFPFVSNIWKSVGVRLGVDDNDVADVTAWWQSDPDNHR
jgi:hypothetical protein